MALYYPPYAPGYRTMAGSDNWRDVPSLAEPPAVDPNTLPGYTEFYNHMNPPGSETTSVSYPSPPQGGMQAPPAGVPTGVPSTAAQGENRWGLPPALYAKARMNPAEQMRLARVLRNPNENSAETKSLIAQYAPPPRPEPTSMAIERLQQEGLDRRHEADMAQRRDATAAQWGTEPGARLAIQGMRNEAGAAHDIRQSETTLAKTIAEINGRYEITSLRGAKEVALQADRFRLEMENKREYQKLTAAQKMNELSASFANVIKQADFRGDIERKNALVKNLASTLEQAWLNMPRKDQDVRILTEGVLNLANMSELQKPAAPVSATPAAVTPQPGAPVAAPQQPAPAQGQPAAGPKIAADVNGDGEVTAEETLYNDTVTLLEKNKKQQFLTPAQRDRSEKIRKQLKKKLFGEDDTNAATG